MIDPQLVIQGLIQRGVPPNAAIGLAGNIAVESGFRTDINELNPIVEGSRGGFGLIQWTGPRRRQFEAYAGQRGVDLSDLDTQLDFLVHELQTTESRAASQIYGAQSPTEAARLTSELFLRPGIPHMDRRIAETERLAGGSYSATQPPQGGQTGPYTPQVPTFAPFSQQQAAQAPMMTPEQMEQNRIQSALASMPEFKVNALNADAFQVQPQQNALAQYGFGQGQSPFL